MSFKVYASTEYTKEQIAAITTESIGAAAADLSNVDMTVLATALGAAKITTGSYVGTGKYGSSNPNSLTFDFVPKIVTVQANALYHGNIQGVVLVHGQTKSGSDGSSSSSSSLTIAWDDSTKSVSWYTDNGASKYQLNNSDGVYYYAAIG